MNSPASCLASCYAAAANFIVFLLVREKLYPTELNARMFRREHHFGAVEGDFQRLDLVYGPTHVPSFLR